MSDTSAYALASILYLCKRMDILRCKISILYHTLWVGENRTIHRGRPQLNLARLPIHGSVKYPVKSHQTLTMTVSLETRGRKIYNSSRFLGTLDYKYLCSHRKTRKLKEDVNKTCWYAVKNVVNFTTTFHCSEVTHVWTNRHASRMDANGSKIDVHETQRGKMHFMFLLVSSCCHES